MVHKFDSRFVGASVCISVTEACYSLFLPWARGMFCNRNECLYLISTYQRRFFHFPFLFPFFPSESTVSKTFYQSSTASTILSTICQVGSFKFFLLCCCIFLALFLCHLWITVWRNMPFILCDSSLPLSHLIHSNSREEQLLLEKEHFMVGFGVRLPEFKYLSC